MWLEAGLKLPASRTQKRRALLRCGGRWPGFCGCYYRTEEGCTPTHNPAAVHLTADTCTLLSTIHASVCPNLHTQDIFLPLIVIIHACSTMIEKYWIIILIPLMYPQTLNYDFCKIKFLWSPNATETSPITLYLFPYFMPLDMFSMFCLINHCCKH